MAEETGTQSYLIDEDVKEYLEQVIRGQERPAWGGWAILTKSRKPSRSSRRMTAVSLVDPMKKELDKFTLMIYNNINSPSSSTLDYLRHYTNHLTGQQIGRDIPG
ncbi:MAG: hypothetical protein M3044_11350 [Thermoproteota archaeon]|nr:hypothetical protein [Thermoproteota archaeon]